jgi:hypothetical protein
VPRAKPKLIIKTTISGEEWTLKLWRSKAYEKLHGDDSAAITTPDENLIEFKENELSLETVAHEMFHANFKYLHLDSTTSLIIDDVEEIIASWIGRQHAAFSSHAIAIYQQLTGEIKC